MTCTACGDAPKKGCGCKSCTKAVLEITNPEKIVLLRKVVIPASMGDDTVVKPTLGKYCNVILYYEANRHIYLYSSDGIPTALESEVPQDIVERIEDLEGEDVRLWSAVNEVEGALETEETTRANADTQLSNAIAGEAQARETAITNEAQARTNAITAETTARENADTNLQNAISDEVTARQTADTNLQTAINTAVQNEAQARTSAISAEATARQTADTGLQTQIDAIVAGSDVKDIVGTYAELQQYDTSTLGDRDIIKVLQDETHQDETTYYRWDASTSTFTLIGEEGPYYTKAAADTLLNAKADKTATYTKTETDTLLNAKADKTTTYTKTETDTLLGAKQDALTAGEAIDITNNVIKATNTGKAKELTSADYNWPVANPDGVALWLLPNGIYCKGSAQVYRSSADPDTTSDATYLVSHYSSTYTAVTMFDVNRAQLFKVTTSNGSRQGYYYYLTTDLVIDSLTNTGTTYPLSANQGYVLNNRIGDLSTLTTTAKTSAVAAINELAESGASVSYYSNSELESLWEGGV